MNSNPTQCEVILGELTRGGWRSMPALSAASGSFNVHSRIAELRRKGVRIECRVEHRPGTAQGKVSWYRLQSPV